MRKAFTLIELIFSMVIISIAFSVLPKILLLSKKSSITSLKEEAMYNAVAYVRLIQATAWDENNTQVDDILIVENGDSTYDCNLTTGYRIGGMKGSRNCFNDKNASQLGSDDNDTDDIDDFEDINTTNSTQTRDYTLKVSVIYIKDIEINATKYYDEEDESSTSTNSKFISVGVQANTKSSVLGNNFVKIHFISQNIGQIKINRRPWE